MTKDQELDRKSSKVCIKVCRGPRSDVRGVLIIPDEREEVGISLIAVFKS